MEDEVSAERPNQQLRSEPKANILLVDDNPTNILVLRAILEGPDRNLIEAHSGQEAIEKLNAGEFAVILLDVQMPGIGGFETAKRMRAARRPNHTPIIFLTAYDSDEFPVEEAYSLGAVDYLVKPFSPTILRAKVSEFVRLFQDNVRAKREADQLRMLIHGTSEYAIFLLDPQGHVVSWNPGAQRIKQYRAAEIIGKHFSQFYPQEAIARGWPEHELAVAKAKGRFEDEGWRIRKDGTQFWANVVITALYDDDGTLRGFSKITRDMTERKQAEENARRLIEEEAGRRAAEDHAALLQMAEQAERRHREQLQVTLASIGDAVIVTDREGSVTFMNPVAVALTGWELRDAAGRSLEEVFRIVNEETRQTVENPVVKVLREGTVVGLANHTVLLARDGREIPIDDSGAPIRGDEGQIAGVVLVFRDVTEQRRNIDVRLRLAAVVESSDDAIISADLKGSIISWNEGAQRLYGYTAEEAIGKPLSILHPPDHLDDTSMLLDRVKRSMRAEHFETVRLRKDGGRVDVSLTCSAVRNSEGKIIGVSKIARDISARKRQEAALRFLAEGSKLLGSLLDVPTTLQKVSSLAVPRFADWCAVDVLERDGSLRRLAVSHLDPTRLAYVRDLNERYPPDPASPRGVWSIIRSGRSELVPLITDELLASAIVKSKRLEFLQSLGLRSYLAVPLTVRGKVLGVITFATAESGRTYDAQDLAIAEDLVQRAAVAIENAQLYQELQVADRRKDEFLATLAHELRNPLAPIHSALQILRLPALDATTHAQTRDMMERQVQHMVRLVDDLMDVSRVMRGKIELRREPVELQTAVTQAVETSRALIESFGHQVVFSLPQEPVLMDADPVRTAQMIGNLVTNAAKYTDANGHIWISGESAGSEAIVRIRDDGIGIAPDMLPHIFDLFVQAEHGTARAYGGLGIGLTLVKNLVELHGGSITAHSAGLGKGSEFVLRLPLPAVKTPAQPQAIDAPRAKPSMRCRVLVVDDNRDAARALSKLLELQGHDICVAHDGSTALAAAAEFQPEVVFLDIGMPGMDGYEVARSIRAMHLDPRPVLAALTGWSQEEDRRRTAEAGFDHHLVKPPTAAQIQQILLDLKAAPPSERAGKP